MGITQLEILGNKNHLDSVEIWRSLIASSYYTGAYRHVQNKPHKLQVRCLHNSKYSNMRWCEAIRTLRHHIPIPSVVNQKKHVYSNDCARLVTNFPAVPEINKGWAYYDRIKSERLPTKKVNETLVIIFYLDRFLPRPFQHIIHSRF